MTKMIFLPFLIISTVTYIGVDAQFLDLAKAIGPGVLQMYKTVSESKAYNDKLNKVPEVTTTHVYPSLKDGLIKIKDKLTKLEEDPADTIMKFRIDDLQNTVALIDDYYDYLSAYSNVSNLSDYIKRNLALQILDNNVGLPYHMVNFHSNLVERGSDSLLRIMERIIEKLDPYCYASQSRQQYFYDFFLKVIATYFKAHFSMEYAFNVTSQFSHSDFNSERKYLKLTTERRINTTVSVFKKIFNRASQELWKCDPPEYNEDINYFRLKNVFRVIFYDDKDFKENDDFRCLAKCPTGDKNHKIVAKCHQRNTCSRKQRVCGNVVECTQTRSGESYYLCVKNSDDGPRYTSIIDSRSLNWWNKTKYAFGSLFGAFNCKNDKPSIVQTFVYGGLADVNLCLGCRCICDETGASDRYFSLKPATSDIFSNKVVTGVRFVKKNNTVFIQIQEGKLLPGGFIDNESTKWKSIKGDDDKDDDDNNNKSEKDALFHKTTKVFNETFKLDWFENRGLYLDDIELPKNGLVTGVRFTVAQNKNQTNQHFLQIDIRSTKFYPESGKLIPELSYWYSANSSESQRHKLDLGNYDTPVSVKVINKPDAEKHQYTFFTPSRLTSKDIGQNVLPFIDSQDVVSHPAAPLSGISLDVKRGGDSGGYLILKIKTYNVKYLQN